MNRPSVLMVVGGYYPEVSGGGLQCRTLMLALRERVTFTVLSISRTSHLTSREVVDGVPVYRVQYDPQSLWTKSLALLRLLFLAPRLIGECQIVHFHGFTGKMLVLAPMAKLARRRIVEKMTSVGHDDPLEIRSRRYGRLLLWMFSRADRFVSVSPAMSERFLAAALPQTNLSFIPNGVDSERFTPVSDAARAGVRAELGLPPGIPIVTFVGFWSREKGPQLVFEAWNRARKACPIPSVLLFVGASAASHVEADPALIAEVGRRVCEERVERDVRFIEQSHDVCKYLQASDVFVLPSSREGLSNALLEAMATALPCVTARIPGVTDWLIEDGWNGFLVPPESVDALAQVLVSLLQDETRRRDVGARARARVLQLCPIENVASAYFDLYNEVLTPNARKGSCLNDRRPTHR